MKKTLCFVLALTLALGGMTFPVLATTVQTGVYNPEQQLIYLTPNSAGTKYEIDTAKHPDGVTIYPGDRFVFQGALNGYGELENYNFVLSSQNHRWYKSVVDYQSVMPIEAGSFLVQLHRYTDGNGTVQNLSPFADVFSCTVTGREAPRYDSLTYTPFTVDNAKIIGRTNPNTPFKFTWENSGVEFDFVGTTVGVEISCVEPQKFIYSIDGVEKTINIQGGTFTYILANDLANEKHTVKILRSGEVWVIDPTLLCAVTDSETITKTPDRDLKIQFIGDSITAGNGLDNYTQDYAYIAAKTLNADSQTFAVSSAYMYDYRRNDGKLNSSVDGIGLVVPFVYSGIDVVPTKGDYVVNEDFSFSFTPSASGSNDPYAAVGEYDFSWVPDVVVINLGTNDSSFLSNSDASSKIEFNKKGFVITYVNFLKRLGELYPGAKFVCSYGLMSCDNTILSLIKEAVDTYNKTPNHNEAVAFKYTLKTDNASPTNSHPGIVSHQRAGAELAQFIKDTFPIGPTTYTADESGNLSLPENPVKYGKVFKGWFDEEGNAFKVGTKLSANEEITLTPVFVDANNMLNGFVDENGTANDDKPVPTSAKYTNGLYVQGAQVRTPADEKYANELGLRFINVVNDDLIKLLKSTDGITDVSFGTLVASSSSVSGTLSDGMTGVSTVSATKIWRNSVTLNSNYDKFTACVVNIPEKHLSTAILVRPYIRYIDASGVVRYLYGEQYNTASIFSVAKAAYEGDVETLEVKQYLYDNIIAKTKGDNDTEIEF